MIFKNERDIFMKKRNLKIITFHDKTKERSRKNIVSAVGCVVFGGFMWNAS
jgi:hypothetical protein